MPANLQIQIEIESEIHGQIHCEVCGQFASIATLHTLMPAMPGLHIADQLSTRIASTGSLACVGLDPRPALLPPSLRQQRCNDARADIAAAFLDFNKRIIDAVHDRCAVLKPQVACYEAYGWHGMRCLEETLAHAAEHGVPVIIDGKRNDIGSTATHYRQAWFGGAPDLAEAGHASGPAVAWQTVNGYLGSDGIEPFLDDEHQHGIFVLVKTSNPGSAEFQGQGEGTQVMERMAKLVDSWGSKRVGSAGLSSIGAVVGATYPEEAKHLRELMPQTLFLVPGYGAQGGGAADALAGLRADGSGVLVNSSRGIIAAWKQHGDDADVGQAARAAVDAMNEDLNTHR